MKNNEIMINKDPDIAIAVKNLSKIYQLKTGRDQDQEFEHHRGASKDFYALKDVSFDVIKGEVMGIIGKNGSGKTTLLRILSGITRPDSGEAFIYGRALSILDIGSNFHPDLSGYENIMMQLRIQDMPKEKFPEIIEEVVEFSEIGRYIHQPVKYYSNGMFMRLAFSVVLNLSADIMILDEVFSVGDEAFRIKCRDTVHEFTQQGKTLLLVSHNRGEIAELCTDCLWLEEGTIKKSGHPVEIIREYYEEQEESYHAQESAKSQQEGMPAERYLATEGGVDKEWSDSDAPGNQIMRVKWVRVSNGVETGKIYTNRETDISVTIEKKQANMSISLLAIVEDTFHTAVLSALIFNNTDKVNYIDAFKEDTGLLEFKCSIPPCYLAEGNYYLLLRFGLNAEVGVENSPEAFTMPFELRFKISNHPDYFDFIGHSNNCAMRPALKWSYTKKA